MIKGSLFYRISMGDFYLYIFSFFLAIFGLVSLFLNFLNLEKIDLVFIFIILPLLMIFLKKELHLQFVNNAYNDFRIVVIASFFTALFYAFYGLFFTYNELLNLELFSRKIITYKSASFVYFDFLSEFLYFVSNLKLFIFSHFGYLSFRALNFIFDFFNFFMFCSLLAFVFNFVLKIKIKIIVLFLCFIMVLGSYFLKEQRNNALKSEQEQILLWMNNFNFLKDYNLSLIQKEKDLFEKDLKDLREIFKKNAFEIGIWWFSKEKEDLEKRINESLK
ncbi:membrane protein [Campylobacter jejuni]|nr:membrane protein [Campylobacter jejuni]